MLFCGVRANVYVDGFNLYFGIRHYEERFQRSHKWLDIDALCRRERPNDQISRIRYFTARVRPRPNNPGQASRQEIYLRALRTIPHLSIHFGQFLESYPRMILRNPPSTGSPFVEVVKMEEKGSDVNIATYLLCDAFANDYGLAILISNDSDLVLPIEVVRTQFKKHVVVLNPGQRFSNALRRVADAYLPIPEHSLAACQFPLAVPDGQGRSITKPQTW